MENTSIFFSDGKSLYIVDTNGDWAKVSMELIETKHFKSLRRNKMDPDVKIEQEIRLTIVTSLLSQGTPPHKTVELATSLLKFVLKDPRLEQSDKPRDPEPSVVVRDFFPKTPPLGNMERRHMMDRLKKNLINAGYYVRPVYLDASCGEYGYFIVAIDDPYELRARLDQGQDQG